MKLSSRLGELVCRVVDNKLIVSDGNAVCMELDGLEVDGVFYPPSILTTTAGASAEGWLGEGSIINRSYSVPGRAITEQIEVNKVSIRISQKVEYTETLKVAFHELVGTMRRQNLNFMENGDTVMVWRDFGSGRVKMSLENGGERPNFVFDSAGNHIYDNRQTRNAGEIYILDVSITKKPALSILASTEGREAVFNVTNHADSQTPQTLAAVMFGTSDKTSTDYGKKGFVGRGVKTSWSAFWISTDEKGQGITNPAFLEVLQDIRAAGHEVMPHRTTPLDDDYRENIVPRLDDYENYFNSRMWIDHSLAGGRRNVGLKSEGAIEGADNYIMDLLEERGYEYVWSYIDEARKNMRYYVDHLDERKTSFPNNLMYQHTDLRFPNTGAAWQYRTWRAPTRKLFDFFTPEVVDRLIEWQGVSLCHEYFAHVEQAGVMFNTGTHYEISDQLDELLLHLSTKQSEGSLWIPTLEEFGDRFQELKGVEVFPIAEGYRVQNNNVSTVKDFTFRISDIQGGVKMNGIDINYKQTTKGIVAWGDLPAGESFVFLT